MGTTIKHTDLSDEDPGPRAIVDSITLGGQLSLTGGKMTLRARLVPGSPFYRLVAAIALTLSGCLCAGILFVIDVPRWAAAAALLLPAAVYLGLPDRRQMK